MSEEIGPLTFEGSARVLVVDGIPMVPLPSGSFKAGDQVDAFVRERAQPMRWEGEGRIGIWPNKSAYLTLSLDGCFSFKEGQPVKVNLEQIGA